MSETYTGSYAPELYNEDKKYYLLQAQQLANLTDAELRDLHNISNTFTRRFIKTEIGDSAVDTAYQITQSLSNSANNFTITGGDGTNPAVIYLDGYRLFLKGNIDYGDQTNTGSLTDDGFTETVLPALTTPNGPTSTVTGLSLNGTTLALTNSTTSTPLYVSQDYGRSWITSSGASGNTLYATSFSDSAHGFAVGESGGNGVVLQTSNGGLSWISAAGVPSIPYTFLDAQFITNFGWVVGQYGTVVKYTGSWTQVAPIIASDLSGVSFSDQSHAWAVGSSGTIIAFLPGNVVWNQQTSDVTSNLARVFAVDASHVFAVGDNGVVLKTTNSGITWGLNFSDTTQNLRDLYFENVSQGWAVGDNGVITHYNGTIWDSTVITPGIDLHAVVFKDTTGFVGGAGGAIYRTLDGINWEPYRTDYVYIDFHLGEVSADTSSEYYDSTLLDPVVGFPSANRLRIVSDVKVSEGFPTPLDYSPDGTVQNYTLNIAKILRPVGQSSILSSMITDTRTVVRTIAEIDNLFYNGGVDTSSIANGAITPAKMDPTGDYTVGALSVTNDVLIQGDLTVDGQLFSDSTVTLGGLIVEGNTQLGNSTAPCEDFLEIYGNVQQTTDGSTLPAYTLNMDSSTSTAIGFDIFSQGKGNVFEVWATSRTSDSTNSIFKSLNLGNGYDFQLNHLGGSVGILNAQDFGSQDSIVISKDSSVFLGSVLNIQSDSISPTLNLFNLSAMDSTTISVDQTAGTMVVLNTNSDANGIFITSQGVGTDIQINHDGSYGTPFVIYNNSSQGAVNIINEPYLDGTSAVTIYQHGNDSALSVNKDGTGLGRGIEVFNWGLDVGMGVYNSGSGVAQLISHVGDSVVTGHDTSNPGLFIYVAGTECGPALLINKSNDNSGEVIKLWNKGQSESLFINHDRTDSSATLFRMDNQTPAGNYDISSNYWWINNRGTFFTLGDVSTSLVAFDSTHYMTADSLWIDSKNYDSSNPAVVGQAFLDIGFLRISDGTSPLPPVSSVPGPQGPEGPPGAPGAAGPAGPAGPSGATVADMIPLGLPTDGTFQSGIFLFDASTITTDAIDDLNGLLLAIAPAPPGSLSGDLVYSGPIKYSAILPTGLSAGLWYQNGRVAGNTITDYVVGNAYTLSNSPGTFKCGSTFGGDVGLLTHYDNGIGTYSRYLSSGVGTTGDLQVSSITVYNSIWHDASAQINYTQANPGFRSHSLLYTVGVSNQQTNNTYFWYDNSNLAPSISAFSVTQNTLSSTRYLSGIRYYSTGDVFNFSASIANLANQAIRPTNPLSYSMPGFNNVDVAINGASFAYNQVYSLSTTVALNASNSYSINAVGTVVGRKPNGSSTTGVSASNNVLVDTYSPTYSTGGNITMFDENYRFPLSTNFSVVPGSVTGNWTSSAPLTNGNGQLYNSVWAYPTLNFTSGYLPAQGGGTNYSAFTGDQTIVWGVNIGTGYSNVQVVFAGMNYTSISPDHNGNLNFDVRLPSATGWLDGGRPFGSFSGDSTGCQLGSSSGNTLQLTFGLSSTSYSSGVVFIRVVLKNASAAQASQMVITGF